MKARPAKGVFGPQGVHDVSGMTWMPTWPRVNDAAVMPKYSASAGFGMSAPLPVNRYTVPDFTFIDAVVN